MIISDEGPFYTFKKIFLSISLYHGIPFQIKSNLKPHIRMRMELLLKLNWGDPQALPTSQHYHFSNPFFPLKAPQWSAKDLQNII